MPLASPEEAPPAWAKQIRNTLSSKPAARGRAPTTRTANSATPRPPSPKGARPAKPGRERDTRQRTQFKFSGCFHCAGVHARKDCKAFQKVLESADINRGKPMDSERSRLGTKVRTTNNGNSAARRTPMPKQHAKVIQSTHSMMGVMAAMMTSLICPTLMASGPNPATQDSALVTVSNQLKMVCH